ncbi:MAG: T9SS type A sorting domain-containing protein, partial [Saprospiraceae bacterium]|nr:T9SS type A sorting domain-containing protein [Saprospiraceae bacterium]
APGQFTVTVTGATGCTREETVLVQATTGAGNLDAAPDWRLWPNPTSGQIFISCAECPSEPLTAVLYHPQGQLVRQLDNFQLPGRVDVSGLSTGLYVLELRGAKSSWGWQRLAVVK